MPGPLETMAGGARITLTKNAVYRPTKTNPQRFVTFLLFGLLGTMAVYSSLVFLSQTDNETTQNEWVNATKNELPKDRQIN